MSEVFSEKIEFLAKIFEISEKIIIKRIKSCLAKIQCLFFSTREATTVVQILIETTLSIKRTY